MSLAMTGKKVILVDLDIRKGTLSSHFDANGAGVTNFLSDKSVDLDSLIHPSGVHPNLDIITNGPIPPNPAELLLSSRLDELFDELRAKYDYIIVDNVPSNMIADAMITSRIADITLYIIRAGILDRRTLPEIEKLYRQQKFKNMAIILNGVDYTHLHYDYSYGYGYGQNHAKSNKS